VLFACGDQRVEERRAGLIQLRRGIIIVRHSTRLSDPFTTGNSLCRSFRTCPFNHSSLSLTAAAIGAAVMQLVYTGVKLRQAYIILQGKARDTERDLGQRAKKSSWKFRAPARIKQRGSPIVLR
jgi:hypothetical protein